jgi:hypothetical protein
VGQEVGVGEAEGVGVGVGVGVSDAIDVHVREGEMALGISGTSAAGVPPPGVSWDGAQAVKKPAQQRAAKAGPRTLIG